ncbi:chemocyanin-like [Phragmites australis]|uniref:chemocyanin-like n=1 Tax=Phragmites australis TaxID=29695 RepID=UPI002D788381|nr:chemocyanin-like [Phragmites australis]
MEGRGRGSASGAFVAVAALLCAAVLLEAAPAAEAGTTYWVGDAAGWTRNVDYSRWLAGKTFLAGDVLVFKYDTRFHDVAWVSKGGYRNCVVSPKGGRAPVFRTGYDSVTLPRGTHYFICGVPGHCGAGMKLAVTVY